MAPYQALAFQVALLLTVVSGQVVLARRARVLGVLAVAGGGILAMVAVSFAVLRWGGLDGLPAFFVRHYLLASAAFCGVVALGTTGAALWLARRDPLPHASIHWGITVMAGLLMYAPATLTRPIYEGDMVIATDDGTGTRSVWHPTPEERMARARTLAPCSIRSLPPRHGAWRWQTIRPVAARLPMPAEMHDEPDEVPDDPGIQQWGIAGWGDIVLQLDTDAQRSSGFFIGGGAGAVMEPACALRVGSSDVPITRMASTVRRRDASGIDSLFTATTDVPIALPDTQLGVGITAHTRGGRDTLLSILAAMRFVDRDQQR